MAQKQLLEIAKALRNNDNVGVLPTDTLYGIVGSALSKKSVARIYRLRKRNKNKPMIVLVDSIADLVRFKVRIDPKVGRYLRKIWPNKISVILPCGSKKFDYLHRGTKTLAFRMPKDKILLSFLQKSGPLVAPSANIEEEKPAETVREAFRYFGNKVDFYVDAGRLRSRPSTLVKIEKNSPVILRKGAASATYILRKML